MRMPFVAGNWKMFTDRATALGLAATVAKGAGAGVAVAVCPPFPYLLPVADALAGSPVTLGAQNCYPEKEGAFTGEVSPAMLRDVGCAHVILGHSERRQLLGETDAFVNAKLRAARAAGLGVILCIGETLAQREGGRTEGVLEEQLTGSLAGLDGTTLGDVVLAYEPVWAIGTGKTATPAQAQEAHAFIRAWLEKHFGEESAARLRILYGGSVKPDNARDLFALPDVDGGLIGGASLKADSFLAIARAAEVKASAP